MINPPDINWKIWKEEPKDMS